MTTTPQHHHQVVVPSLLHHNGSTATTLSQKKIFEDRKEEEEDTVYPPNVPRDTPRTVSINILRKWLFETHPFDRKDDTLRKSWEMFQRSMEESGGRVRAVDLVHLASLYERHGDFFRALKFFTYVIEEFPKYEKLAEVAFRCASLLVQLQFDENQKQTERGGNETKLLLQALHYMSKISVHRPYGLSESEMFLILGRVHELFGTYASRHLDVARDAYEKAYERRTRSEIERDEEDETSSTSEDEDEEDSSPPLGLSSISTSRRRKRFRVPRPPPIPKTKSPKIKHKNKSFRAGKVQKKVKTDEWIEWFERPAMWKRWAQRLSRLGLFTFSSDAYVRFMSFKRRDIVPLSAEEHVEIADVMHVTPLPVLSSKLLFRACKTNSFHLEARFRLHSWYPNVYAQSSIMVTQDISASKIQAMVRGSHARDMVSAMIMRNAILSDVSSSSDDDTSSEEEQEEANDEWIECYDENQMAVYYTNRHTMETKWEKPKTKQQQQPRRTTQRQRKSSVVYISRRLSTNPKFVKQQNMRRKTRMRKCSVIAFGRRRSTIRSTRSSIIAPGLNRMRRSVFYGGEDVEKFDRESASILIQSAARGYLVRSLNHRKERSRLANEAAIRVQARARQILARSKLRKLRVRFDVRTRAALRLQCVSRKVIARNRRNELSSRRKGAIKFQSMWRQHVASKHVEDVRRKFAAACLQRALLCYRARETCGNLRRARDRLRCTRRIQSFGRALLLIKKIKRYVMATRIQRMCRGCHGRVIAKKRREERAQQRLASLVLVQYAKQWFMRKSARSQLVRYRSIRNVQSHMRGWLARRWYRRAISKRNWKRNILNEKLPTIGRLWTRRVFRYWHEMTLQFKKFESMRKRWRAIHLKRLFAAWERGVMEIQLKRREAEIERAIKSFRVRRVQQLARVCTRKWHQYTTLSIEINRRFRLKNRGLVMKVWRLWQDFVKSCQIARTHSSASKITALCRAWMCRKQMLPPHILPFDLTPSKEREILRRRQIVRWRGRRHDVARTFNASKSKMTRLTIDSDVKNRTRATQYRIVNLSPSISITSEDFDMMIESPTHSLHAHSVPLTSEDGITISKSILRSNVNLKALSFDGCGLGNRGAVALLDALMNIFKNRAEEEGEEVQLVHFLALSDCGIGHRTICALARAARCGMFSNLTSLYLDGVRSRERSASSMSRILRSGVLERLKMFSMARALIGDIGGCRIAQSLASTPSLTSLDLSGNDLTESTARALVKALEYSRCRISALVLSGNRLGDDGTVAIARALPRFPCLEHLDLSSNNVGNAGISALSRGLRMDGTLRVLVLTSNPLNDIGLRQLVSTVQDSHNGKIVGACNLAEVDVSRCPGVSLSVQKELISLLMERTC